MVGEFTGGLKTYNDVFLLLLFFIFFLSFYFILFIFLNVLFYFTAFPLYKVLCEEFMNCYRDEEKADSERSHGLKSPVSDTSVQASKTGTTNTFTAQEYFYYWYVKYIVLHYEYFY